MKRSVISVVVALSAMALFAGCSGEEQSFTQKSYKENGTGIKEISIDVRDREIEVLQSEDEKIHIEYSESEKEYYDIAVSADGVLTMTAADDKKWSDYIGGKASDENRKISLKIPDSRMTSLEISTTNEDIEMSSLNVTGDIALSVNGGDISFADINAENSITLTAKNGDIEGSIVGGYDDYAITCEIKKGDSNLPAEKEGGAKELSVNANNGDIEIEFVK